MTFIYISYVRTNKNMTCWNARNPQAWCFWVSRGRWLSENHPFAHTSFRGLLGTLDMWFYCHHLISVVVKNDRLSTIDDQLFQYNYANAIAVHAPILCVAISPEPIVLIWMFPYLLGGTIPATSSSTCCKMRQNVHMILYFQRNIQHDKG